ncbi:MAG: YggT family protein [Firmicutes bacterium]|nr:YggT family protein [Bacillota bacterium]
MSVKETLIQALLLFGRIMDMLILVRVLMSWFRPQVWSRETQWFFRAEEFVVRLTEPVLAPIRRILPTGGLGLDFSPIVAAILLEIVIKTAITLIAALPVP